MWWCLFHFACSVFLLVQVTLGSGLKAQLNLKDRVDTAEQAQEDSYSLCNVVIGT